MSSELLNPNKTWTIGSGGQLSTLTATTIEGDVITSKTTGGTITVDSALRFNGGLDLNGQTISGNSGNLTNFSQISGATLSATSGFVGNLAGNVIGNVTGTVSSIANHDTGELTEGSNKYFTDARARGAMSVTDAGGDGSLAYNSATGAITYTGASADETRAHFSAGTGVAVANGEFSIGQSVATDASVAFKKVTANLTGNVTGTVSSIANHDTDVLAEGLTNKYFTDARARSAMSVVDAGGDGSMSYNSTTGAVTYTGPSASETRAHFSGTTNQVTLNNGVLSLPQSISSTNDVQFNKVTANVTGNLTGNVSGNVTGTVSSIANHDTTDLSEGDNKYFTDARARSAMSATKISGDGSIAYNSASGVISYTGASADETRAHFSAGTGVSVTDGQFSIDQSVATNADVIFNQVTAKVVGTVSSISNHDTDVLAEGLTNKYFSNTLARSAVSVSNVSGDGSVAYNSTSGVISYTGASADETRAHFSAGTGVAVANGEFSIGQSVAKDAIVEFTKMVGDVEGNVTGTVSSIANHSTTTLEEGTNKYFTDARARGAMSVTDAGGDGSLAYNASTGAITYTGASATETRAHFSAGTGLSLVGGEFSLPQEVASDSDVQFKTVRLNDEPTQAYHAANKQYVDATSQGLDVKDSVRVATIGSIDLTGLQSIDGITVIDGDRVLVKDQDDSTKNGIYNAGEGEWKRSSDMDEPHEIKGAFTFVEEGKVNEAAGFVQSGSGTIVVGTSPIEFTQFSGAGSVIAGTGLSKDGNTIIVNAEQTQVTRVGTLSELTMSGSVDLVNNDINNVKTINATSVVATSLSGTLTGTVSSIANHNTDTLVEGVTNQYFTDTRARGAVSVTDAGGDGSLAYNSSTGAITYTGASADETRAHFSAGTGVAVASGEFSIGQSVAIDANVAFNKVTAALVGDVTGTVSSIANHDTDNLVEGTNKYFTNARARGAMSATNVSGDGSIAYNSGTGAIAYTGPSALETRAHFSAGTGVAVANGEFSIGQSVATSANVAFKQVTAALLGDVTGNLNGDVTGTVSSIANHSTTTLAEGTNKYFTDSRARGAMSVVDAGGDGSLAYNASTGAITYTGASAAETRSHFSAGTGVAVVDGEVSIGQSVSTDADVLFNKVTASLTGNVTGNVTGDVIGDVTGTVSSIANHSTTTLTEGSNKYFTDARARDAMSTTNVSGDGSLAYDSATGAIAYTGPSAVETRAHFSAGTGVTVANGEFSIGQSVAINDDVRFNKVTANLAGNVTGDVTGSLTTANDGEVAIKNAGGYSVGLKASEDTAADFQLKLPADVGGNGQVLKTDGTGNLTWGSGASGVVKQFVSKTQHEGAKLPSVFATTGGQVVTPTGYAVSISPVSSTSKVFIMFKVGFRCSVEPMQRITFSVYRTVGGVETLVVSDLKQGTGNSSGPLNGIYISNYVDEPGSMNECTYTLKYELESSAKEGESTDYQAGIVGGADCANCLALQEVEGSGVSASLLNQAADANGIYYNKGTLTLDSNSTSVNAGNISGVSLNLGGAYRLPDTPAGFGIKDVRVESNGLFIDANNVSYGTGTVDMTEGGEISALEATNLRANSQIILLLTNKSSGDINIPTTMKNAFVSGGGLTIKIEQSVIVTLGKLGDKQLLTAQLLINE